MPTATYDELIEIARRVPETSIETAIEFLKSLVSEPATETKKPACVHCGSSDVNRNGHRRGRQRYICNECGSTFGDTTKTIMFWSHSDEKTWRTVIDDTINGVSLAKTADKTGLNISTVFNMRHKILLALETEADQAEVQLSGVCELDDTYVLESLKGTKLPEDYDRAPRKHGATATKRGISNEQISICTGISRNGGNIALTVNRATPSKENVKEVFENTIADDSLVICDGAKSYNILCDVCNCEIRHLQKDENGNYKQDGFTNINTANGFHSVIKQRYNKYGGVATKYLNRYNALFAKIYRAGKNLTEEIYSLLTGKTDGLVYTVNDVQTRGLLIL